MNTKLTLSIDDKIVKKAKDFSRLNGRSLSKLIENYLRSITFEKNELKENDLPEALKKWHGAFKQKGRQSYKEVVAGEIFKKLDRR